MAFEVGRYIELSPLKVFVTHENGADIYVALGTDKVRGGSDLEYADIAFLYHQYFAAPDPERMILISNEKNTARNMAYLLAGYDKWRLVRDENGRLLQDENGRLAYEGTHESEGVYMAEINLSEYGRAGREFPGSEYKLDGAIFYGENEKDIKDNLNALKSCDLRFVALIISDNLWNTDTVRRLVLDNEFPYLDVRGHELDDDPEYYINLLRILGEDNDRGTEDDNMFQEILYPNGKSDDSLYELYYKIRRIRGKDFVDEDLIHIPERMMWERRLDDKMCILPGLLDEWEEKPGSGTEQSDDA